ncbi:MAG: hypothetical protein AAB289_06325, partial [Chloroflexota bacterium]
MMDWVAGSDPRETPGFAERADQLVQALWVQGIHLRLAPGRSVSAAQFDPGAAHPAGALRVMTAAGPVALDLAGFGDA